MSAGDESDMITFLNVPAVVSHNDLLRRIFGKKASVLFFFYIEHDRSCLENALERDCANHGQRFAQAA